MWLQQFTSLQDLTEMNISGSLVMLVQAVPICLIAKVKCKFANNKCVNDYIYMHTLLSKLLTRPEAQ